MEVLCSRSTVIIATLPRHSNKYLPKIKLVYLTTTQASLICHSLDHATDLLPPDPDIMEMINSLYGPCPTLMAEMAARYPSPARYENSRFILIFDSNDAN